MKRIFVLGLALLLCGHAQAQTLPPSRTIASWLPIKSKCINILEFEGLNIDHRSGNIHLNLLDQSQLDLATQYNEMLGWVKGYITARNSFDPTTDGTIGTGMVASELMIWIYSYCRSRPSDSALQAAYALSTALAAGSH